MPIRRPGDQPAPRAGRSRTGRYGLGRGALAAALMICLAAACSSAPGQARTPAPSSSRAAQAGRTCGRTRTAASVPVEVQVAKGRVSCATAMMIARLYAAAVRSGRAPGNGGGGPIKVDGWTCQGFPTPTVLNTGKASKCVSDGDEILEIVPATG